LRGRLWFAARSVALGLVIVALKVAFH
jgi:hypothetical protein